MLIYALTAAFAATLPSCSVTDGDTIRCGLERIRLLGIDAPETHGCPKRRRCAPGSGRASTESLRAAMAGSRLSITRVGKDRYGRTLGVVTAGGRNLSCQMLRARQAIYKPQWDDGHRVLRACPSSARARTQPEDRRYLPD